MLLEVRNLHVGYGDATAKWDVSIDVAEGSIVTVIGPNGAGKRRRFEPTPHQIPQ